MIVYTDKWKVPFQIDDDDYEVVRRYTWATGSAGYIVTHVGKGEHCRLITLHLFLLGPAGDGLEWDHENRDKKDNQRHNLRRVTNTVNTRNRGLMRTNTSGVPGVSWNKRKNKWKAQIKVGGPNHVFLGYFADLEVAAAVRREAERTLWA